MIAGICKECGIVSAMFRDSCKEKGGFLITTGWIWCKKRFYRHVFGIWRWHRHIGSSQIPGEGLVEEGFFKLVEGVELLLVEGFEPLGLFD